MSSTLAAYLAAAFAALALLYLFGRKAWYLHALSLLIGLLAGLMAPPWGGGELFYLVAGSVCVFGCLWGLGGLLLPRRDRPSFRGRKGSRSDIAPAV
jgi:hypothetical protein